jgi:hypothetical protein
LHLSDLAVDAPLRSIDLNLGQHVVLAESLMRYLVNYEGTLKHFTLVARIEDEPRANLHLPRLRQLRLGVSLPHLLLPYLLTCPITVLDVYPFSGSQVHSTRDYYPSSPP